MTVVTETREAFERIPDGFPVRKDIKEITIATDFNIHRRAVRFHGNAYDLTRLKEACDRALKKIEHNRLNPNVHHVAVLQVPADDES
jgi:hypothetical protein